MDGFGALDVFESAQRTQAVQACPLRAQALQAFAQRPIAELAFAAAHGFQKCFHREVIHTPYSKHHT